MLLNLEDLWLEPLPQNVPGTWEERPNWKRKARFSLDEIRKMNSVTEILKAIDEIRKRLPHPNDFHCERSNVNLPWPLF